MTDDATKALADVKADIAKVGEAESKAKAWYASHLFYAGMIAMVVIEAIGWLIHKVL